MSMNRVVTLLMICSSLSVLAEDPNSDETERGGLWGAPSDQEVSCEVARERMANGDPSQMEPADRDIYRAKQAQCDARDYNAKHPDDPEVVIAYFDPTSGPQQGLVFSSLRLSEVEKLRAACRLAVGVATGAEAVGDPLTSTVSGVAGTYSCDSYAKAAAKEDPMMLAMPMMIPGRRLVGDVWRETRKAMKPFESDGKTPGGVVPGTKIPLAILSPQVALAVAAGGTATEVKKTVDWTIEKAASTASKPVKSALNEVCFRLCRGKGKSKDKCKRKCS